MTGYKKTIDWVCDSWVCYYCSTWCQ